MNRFWRIGIGAVAAAVASLIVPGCAARRPRSFTAATVAQAERAWSAYRAALERFGSLDATELLYEARLSRGIWQLPGTLAVRQAPGRLEASLAGPFGQPIARYADGVFSGEGIRPLLVEPERLRWLLGGVWEGDPALEGIDAGDALFVWEGSERAEGILDIALARFKSLRVRRPEGELSATYGSAASPWPERVDLQDTATGSRLALKLIALGRPPASGMRGELREARWSAPSRLHRHAA